MTLVANGQQSDRFLDPIHPDNFHNHGALGSAESQLMWSASDSDVVTANVAFGAMDYDVPNNELQETASQDQRQQIRRGFTTLSWQHGFSSSTFSQLAVYTRRSKAALAGSEADTPLVAVADRRLVRSGVIAGLSRRVRNHTIKTGFEAQRLSLDESFAFAVTDPEDAEEAGFSEAALAYTIDQPFAFAGRANPMSWSAFLQDEWTVRSGLTLSGGVRFDSSGLGPRRQQVSPRVGAAYRADGTVLRGSVSRFFQPPQPENFLLSSSEEARVLSPFATEGGSGGAELEPERQWMFEAGVNHQFASRMRSRRRGVAPHNHRRRRSQCLRRHDDHLSECRLQGPRRRHRSSRRAAATIVVVRVSELLGRPRPPEWTDHRRLVSRRRHRGHRFGRGIRPGS